MKIRFMVLVVIFALIIALTACSADAPEGANHALEANSPSPTHNPNTTSEHMGITAIQAGAIAVELVGGGIMQGLEAINVNGNIQFIVTLNYNGNIYDVVLDAQSGEFISLRLIEEPQQQEPISAEDAEISALPPSQDNLDAVPDFSVNLSEFNFELGTPAQAPSGSTPSPIPSPPPPPQPPPSPPPQNDHHRNHHSPSHSSGQGNRPSNPAISLERAIEIGYAEIARRGHTGTFRTHSGMDWERGQWVWELEFSVQGGRLPLVEMYINVDTGSIVKFEWDD